MTIKVDLMGISTDIFTPREKQVIVLIVEGKTDKVIAKILAISFRTVAAHAHVIYKKLGLLNEKSIGGCEDNLRCMAIITMIARGMVLVSELQSDKALPTSHQYKSTNTLDVDARPCLSGFQSEVGREEIAVIGPDLMGKLLN